jgi:prepilin-type processing-associated H-X9-DG protein
MYQQDYDGETMPLTKSWIDNVTPYIDDENIFKCPSVTSKNGYGYAYNSNLSNQPASGSHEWDQNVFLYETSILKRNAYGTGENLAFRHQNGANYVFADGHVKWFPKTQIPSFKLKP